MSERRRKLAFAATAAVLLGIACFLALRDSGPSRPPQADQGSSAVIRTESRAGPEPGRAGVRPQSPSPEHSDSPLAATAMRGGGEKRDAPAVAPGDGRAAAAAARTFLAGYLPYSYGRARARRIRSAAAPLLRELERSPPRVPPAVARSRPRLISVWAQAATGRFEIVVRAVVDDGRRRYSIPLSVRDRHGRWVVTAFGG